MANIIRVANFVASILHWDTALRFWDSGLAWDGYDQ